MGVGGRLLLVELRRHVGVRKRARCREVLGSRYPAVVTRSMQASLRLLFYHLVILFLRYPLVLIARRWAGRVRSSPRL